MIQFNRIFLRVSKYKTQLATSIPGSKFHYNIQEYSWPVQMIKTVQAHFPDAAAQLQVEYDKYVEHYAKEQAALARARSDKRQETRTGGGKKYVQEIRQDAKLLAISGDEADSIYNDMKRAPDPMFPYKLKPYYHQIQMIKAGIKYDKLAYFCEMGTGKTKVIVDLMRIKARGQFDFRPLRAIIFAPKSVIFSWGDEIDKNSDLKYNICTGTRKQKLKALLDKDADVVVTNYETAVTFGVEPELWGTFNMVVLDESSKIKSHKAKRTNILHAAFKQTPFKYILSGTPITQNPADIWAQLFFLDDKILGNKNYFSFRNRYCIMGGFEKHQVIGYKDLPILKEKISASSLQLKKDECLDLPEKVYQVRKIEMSTHMKEQYKQMHKQSVLELKAQANVTAPIVLTKILRLQEILSGKYLEKGRNEKAEELMDIINKAIGYGRQIVVWCKFRASIDIISARLETEGIPCSIFHGDTRDRKGEIDKFQSGEHKVFVGQERTGGLGITLHSGNVMVYFENEFSLEVRKQSEDRIHRIGQNKKCLYIDLVYEKTVDTMVLKAIKNKQDIATYLVDSFKEGEYELGSDK